MIHFENKEFSFVIDWSREPELQAANFKSFKREYNFFTTTIRKLQEQNKYCERDGE